MKMEATGTKWDTIGPILRMQAMYKTGDMQTILNGDIAALGFGTNLAASQASPRAEGAARREGEWERRLRGLRHDIGQRPPGGFVIDPMHVPITIA